jgi:hypothetical protein
MTEQRDATLQALFNESQKDLQDDRFSDQVMVRVDRLKRRKGLALIGIELLLVLVAWLLSEPLQSAVYSVMPSLMSSLIELDNSVLASLLLPVNNPASILLLAAIGLRSAYRRFFS